MKNMRNARRIIALGLVIVLVVLMGAGSQKSDPSTIHIRNAEDLKELSVACKYDAYSRDKTVILDNDLDLTDTEFTPIPTFGGTFNGQGHTISGLSLSGDGAHMGLFRYVQAGGTVQDLTVSGTVDSAGTLTEIGAIVGTNMGTITGCNFSGSISGKNNVGGIAGTNEVGGMIYNCKSEGFVAGDHYVGGTVGQNLGTVSYCSNTAGVNVNTEDISVETIDEISLSDDSEDDAKEANTSTDVGGIVGFSSGVVIGCTNWGTVGYQHVGYNIGGIAGRQSGLVTGCTNWGTALGRKDVGGVVGQMEPFIELDSGAGSIGKMEQDLNTLHDQMNVLLGHTGAAASDMSATLGSISAAAGRATEHARVVAERTMDYVDETGDTVNELMVRINTSEKMVAPAITEFSQGSISLETATGYFANGFDDLDAIDEMSEADKTGFKNAAGDLSVSTDKLNASMAYLGWLMKAADNSYGTGNFDLESERPATWEHDAEMYGYEYNPAALTSYEQIRDAMLRGAGDASGAAGAISGDVSTMTKVINTYYLTEDEDGNTRMDNMSAAFKSAFDSLQQSTGHLSTGMSYLDQMAGYLSGNETLEVPSVDSDYRTEMEGMFDELSSISAGLSRLATQTAGYSNIIMSDMRAVNDTFNVVMMDLCDILELALDPDAEDIIEDVSEEDYATINTGKVYNCQNYGVADGDVAVGGIAGTMAIEYDFDPESDSTILSETSLTSKYFTKCVLMDSTNYGTSVSRKDYSGGICGESDLGVIVGCEGYGSAESKLGSYVGGIAGMSKGSIRDSYAKCELTGENYVGGVAGLGKNITNCSTLMNLNAEGNCVGTIAGELDDEGEASGNYFVHDSEGGIDGISYEGKAQALSYEDFMKRDGVPAEFSSFTATFTANGEVVKTIVFAYGASIDESEIPECPPVEGNYGKWPDFDYNNLTFDVEIRAEYTASSSSVSGDLVNEDGTPVVILEGVFDPDAEAVVTESKVDGPSITGDRETIGQYEVHVENDSLADDADRGVTVRVNVPKGGSYNVYALRDGKWDTVSYTRDGSYLVFESPDRDVTFSVVRTKRGPLLYILLGLAGLALLIGVIRALLKRKKRKADAVKAEAPAVDTPVGTTDAFTADVVNADEEINVIDRSVEAAPPVADEITTEVELEAEVPAVEAELPEVEVEVPAVEAELPEVEVEAPAVEAELPEVEVEAPAVEAELPEVEVEAPAVEAELPEVEVEAPAVEAELPEIEVEAPAVEIETPEVKLDAPVVEAAAATAAAAVVATEAKREKKGLFSFLRRKKKDAEAVAEAVVVTPAAAEVPEVRVEDDDVDLQELVNKAFAKVETAEEDSFDRVIADVHEEVSAELPEVEAEIPEAEVEVPEVEVEAPEVEVEVPEVEAEIPEVEVEVPEVEAEIPEVEVELPEVEAEAPEVEVEVPEVEVEIPEVEVEIPEVEAEIPEVEVEVPEVEAEIPEVEVEVPEVEVEIPEVEVEVPEVEVEAPEVEVEVPEVEIEAPEAEVELPKVEAPAVEAAAAAAAVAAPKREKKGLFSFLRRKNHETVTASEPEVTVETPEAEVKLPETEVEIPEVEAELPEVEVEVPTVEAELPEVEIEVPEVEVEVPEVEAELPEIEVEIPEAEVEIPEIEVEIPEVKAEAPEAVPEMTSLESFIADIRSTIPDLPEEATVVETGDHEIPLFSVPYVEETPAAAVEAPEVKAEPVVDEVPLVAVPYVEETPAAEAEAPAADTSSLDAFIASIRGTIAEIPAVEAEIPEVEVPAVEVPVVEAEIPEVEVEVPAAEAEIPAVAVEIPEGEVPAAKEEPTSLETFIANIRSSIADLPEEATVVETEAHEIPLFSVPFEAEQQPEGTFRAVPVSADEVPLVAVPYEAPAEVETPVHEPTSLETFIASIRSSIADLPEEATVVKTTATEIPLFSVPYVEKTPAAAVEVPEVKAEPVIDEVPLVAVPYVEETPAAAVEAPEVKAEPVVDEVPLVAVPYVEETPAAEPTSLDTFIASIRGTIAEIPAEKKAEEPVVETVPAAAKAEAETTESLDDVIRFVRETCADVEQTASDAAAESHTSLEELIAQVRGTISDVQAEPTSDSLDDVIRYVKDNVPDDEA